MTKHLTILLIILMETAMSLNAYSADNLDLIIAYTTDVHGHFFPYDFIKGDPASGSLARVSTAVDSLRARYGTDRVVLLDNGDILQGQPTVYYYNFIDTVAPHIVTDIYKFLGYDATSVGNHDIETGHAVYDRWKSTAEIPVLAANVIDRSTGQPYFQPYTIINRNGLRVAIIGLLTPAIPAWLPENLWKGLEFLPMEESARKWVEIVRSSEAPDVVIGLFHSGRDASKTTAGYKENESLTIARQVDGFDAVLMGHDHQLFCDYVTAPSGKSIAVINPANNANNLGTILLQKDASGKIILTPHNIDLTNTNPSEKYLDHFKNQFNEVKQFVEQPVSEITADISTRDAYFGPSAFMTLLHRLQHEVSGAQISMAAPLTFDGLIKKGQLTIADMFTLYKYENNLTTLKLTGKEIKDYLEYSYDLWLNRIENDADHLIRFASESPTISDNRLKNPSYNFDSASGINYTVDVTQGKGNRVQIISLADGSPFDPDSTYTVAINSYRAGGGGNHLTEGSGLSPQQLKGRIVKSTDKDLRYYLMQVLKKSPQIKPEIDHNWKMIPEDIATRHAAIDRQLLFSPESSKNQK